MNQSSANIGVVDNTDDDRLNLTALLLLAASAICISPIFLTAEIFRGNILSLIFLIGVVLINKGIFSKVVLTSVIILLFFSIINVIYWGDITLKVGIYFYSIFLIISFIRFTDIYKYTDYLSKFLLIMLSGSVIGFLYAYFGGEAMFTFPNEDGRPNSFYLTTLSTHYVNGLIRPSGIFDEPGALSFIICVVAALRESLGMSRKTTWILLIGGFITLSTAHAIFFVGFWIAAKWNSVKGILTSIFVAALVLFILMSIDSPISTIIEYVFHRFSIVDGSFVGDNRSVLLISAYNYLDLRTFLFGLDGSCIMGSPLCLLKGYRQFCCNPLTLIVHYGIFLALPYYLTLIYIMFKVIKHKNLVIFGVFLLLCQRPYTMSYGYAVLLFIYVYSLTFTEKLSYIKSQNTVV